MVFFMEKKTMTNAFDSMDLNTAYEIAGGYIEADDEIFAKDVYKRQGKDRQFRQTFYCHSADYS